MGKLASLWLMLRGALGSLSKAEIVESFKFMHMQTNPRALFGRHPVKVAANGDMIQMMRWPLVFSVLTNRLCRGLAGLRAGEGHRVGD